MAPNNHRKEHHAHETTDAFAEGWDARERAMAAGKCDVPPVNPYRVELAVIAELHSKRSARQLGNMARDADLWDAGWRERIEAEELERV